MAFVQIKSVTDLIEERKNVGACEFNANFEKLINSDTNFSKYWTMCRNSRKVMRTISFLLYDAWSCDSAKFLLLFKKSTFFKMDFLYSKF